MQGSKLKDITVLKLVGGARDGELIENPSLVIPTIVYEGSFHIFGDGTYVLTEINYEAGTATLSHIVMNEEDETDSESDI